VILRTIHLLKAQVRTTSHAAIPTKAAKPVNACLTNSSIARTQQVQVLKCQPNDNGVQQAPKAPSRATTLSAAVVVFHLHVQLYSKSSQKRGQSSGLSLAASIALSTACPPALAARILRAVLHAQ